MVDLSYFIQFREKKAMIDEEYLEVDGKILTDRKKRRTVRRIQEWEKFEENCIKFKESERRKQMNVEDITIQINSKEEQRKTACSRKEIKTEVKLAGLDSHEIEYQLG